MPHDFLGLAAMSNHSDEDERDRRALDYKVQGPPVLFGYALEKGLSLSAGEEFRLKYQGKQVAR